MTIIPNNPYKTNSNAEYRVFDKIKESFVNDNKYLAFHSLNLTKHERKKFGEADFVIVCEYGLFVFEVKGGGVSCTNDEWHTINKDKEEHKIQNPFKQVEGALRAIVKDIEESYKFNNLLIPIGYGVIFPDVEWTQLGSEWNLNTICDSRKFKNFESWLRIFFKYWHNKSGKTYSFSLENINNLKQYLRPNFELIEPLHIKLSQLEDSAVALTKDQYKYLDIVTANKRVLCSGGAGTGKTFLAAELSRRLANENTRISFICKSTWLKRYLESKIKNEFVTISTIDSARVDMRREGLTYYDMLIVDEGQDLFDFEDIEILENLLNGGLSNGEWYIFHDVNNQSGLFIDTKIEVLNLLESYSPAIIPLSTNCRNTYSILNKVQKLLHLDMGTKGTGIGPEVHEIINNKESGLILKNEINNILKNGIASEAITILSPVSYEKSSISSLPESLKKSITKLDDFSIRSFPVENISFAEIRNFKGLENEVIIVIDLINPANREDNYNKVLHYVAMSRARSLLCVIWE